MEKTTEGGVEAKVLEYLEEAGWDVRGDPAENEWGSTELDRKYDRGKDEAVYWSLLKQKIVELNEKVDEDDAQEIVDNLKRDLGAENLLKANEEFYEKMRNGVPHTVVDDEGDSNDEYVDLIHFPDDERNLEELMEKNSFIAVNQFQFERRNSVRPDVTLIVNGIPVVHFELKNVGPDSTVQKAMNEMESYQEDAQRMFVPSLLNVVSDGIRFRYAATDAPQKFYFPWRSEDFEEGDNEVRDAVLDLFDPGNLMDLFRYYVFFSDDVKVVPRYMQFHAANRMIERLRKGEPRKGLIWHTQGSGKSYTMMFAAHKAKKSPTVADRQQILVVDRRKLEDQMADDLHDIGFPIFDVADSIGDLEDILEEDKNQLVLTTIQKFEDVDSEIEADPEGDAVVMVDEAHRFTEGVLGSRLRNALPDAFYFGFTGTPVVEDSKGGRNTFREFSPKGEDYLHRYSIEDGQRDGVITEVTFTKMKVEWGEIPEDVLDQEFEGEFGDLPLQRRQEILRKYVNESELAELRPRMEEVVKKILGHFEDKVEPIGFKGMVVTPSRRAAALYCDEIRKYRDEDEAEAIISGDGNDDDFMKKYVRSEEEEKTIVENFKKEENPKLLVVCDKLLTGFDAPILKTMYLDKSISDHNLLQAIARTNRPMSGKKNGEIVDFAGVFDDPEKALQYEEFEIVEEGLKETEELVEEFIDLEKKLVDIFDIEFTDDPEKIQKAVAVLQREEDKASRFLEMFSEAENIYESVQPHEKLGDQEVITRWKLLNQIHYEFQEMQGGSRPNHEKISGNVREKTKEILEENLEVEKIEPEEESVNYNAEGPDVKRVEEKRVPEYSAAAEGALLEENTELKARQNPAFKTLSERVKQVIKEWREDDLSSDEALEEYEEVEERIEEIESEQEDLGMTETEFALYKLMSDEYSDYFSREEAQEIVESIYREIEEMNFESVISTLRKELRRKMIIGLTEKGKTTVIKEDDEFLDKAVDLIVRNEKDERDRT